MLALETFLSLTEKKSPRPSQSRVQVTPVEIVVRMLRVIRHQKNRATRLFLSLCRSTAKYYTQYRPEIIIKKKQILALGWNNIDSLSLVLYRYMRQHQLRSDHHREFLFGVFACA